MKEFQCNQLAICPQVTSGNGVMSGLQCWHLLLSRWIFYCFSTWISLGEAQCMPCAHTHVLPAKTTLCNGPQKKYQHSLGKGWSPQYLLFCLNENSSIVDILLWACIYVLHISNPNYGSTYSVPRPSCH